jgi:glycine hydroxymethyltransferase
MSDFLFRGSLADLDPKVHHLNELEAERQFRRLILIPSESTSPNAVRETLSSAFHNIYAEGYPDENTRKMTEDELFDYDARLGHYRRHSDPRYYKGVEYANIVEALARRRCAETFAANGKTADDVYVNVQALSGAPANNAVYHALVKPGDTVMGMDLLHGGHLSHGSPANRSGKYYNIVHYTIDPVTEKLDYDQIERLALEHKPKLLISGFSSYSWEADWHRLREIADKVGAYLMADISHVAGLVAGGVYQSPVGIADVVTSTTHKTMCGPRGAIIMTTKKSLSTKIDKAVFPGEQGGPHVNVFAALALTFKIAQSDEFSQMQHAIVKNNAAFTNRFVERGFKIPFGGTDCHLMNLDCSIVKGADGTALSGDMAARILDLAGIVVNRNTIPGDKSPLNPSGVRMGTPWITQRGFGEKESIELADIISDLLFACTPYKQKSTKRKNRRAKVTFEALEKARIGVRELAINHGIDFEPTEHGYPHFFYEDDVPMSTGASIALDIKGTKAINFLNHTTSNDVLTLADGEGQATQLTVNSEIIDATLVRISETAFRLSIASEKFGTVATWLRDLSDGFVFFDEDVNRKLPGGISVREFGESPDAMVSGEPVSPSKPFYIGIPKSSAPALPKFEWTAVEGEVRTTALHATHKALGAKMVPFAGYDMPVWYTSVVEEHLATRQAAGLFDVSHMGVYQAEGPEAVHFLDSVCANHISTLSVGESLYTHFLDTDANVIDDLLVYRRGEEKYLVVVNASNDDKNWAWLTAVKAGTVMIDAKQPAATVYGRNVVLRNLRDAKEGADQKLDIALQGPNSRKILLAMGVSKEDSAHIKKLKRTQLCEATVGGFDLVVSRTGYTGEKMAFELFVHPDQVVDFWNATLKAGEAFGLKPCGLAARDSLRTEAGLPLYGHEMGDANNLSVGDANFRTYVKTYKPWFIGRDAFMAREAKRTHRVVRFRFAEKGVRMAHQGDPVVDKRGKTIGHVTSCAVDSDGYLTGQAYLPIKGSKLKTEIWVFSGATDKQPKATAKLGVGDRIAIPNLARVVTRFA